ncbi:zinc finger HIT domain-containing protein 1 isoform X2 [Cololabis saira]|uniref:zinc finger HIT domain-containing protein 1 isoform X1 n=1 Tax=Cololabis saira TaxID=129043 RepID=UPI002AD5943D|nr:zinc finger HIT domain-containing protein 1 isoform X1 [Cololabis saira]XP_061566290.1 zinc finger HIT domain-containing protein 1 isoform X2 [Cololabis saira]
MVLEKKTSARVEASGQRRVLDEATRQRRLTRQLDALEKDNFQDDPLSSLPPPGPTARLPAFSETEEPEKKRRKTRGDHFKQRFRKNFTALLEEEVLEVDALMLQRRHGNGTLMMLQRRHDNGTLMMLQRRHGNGTLMMLQRRHGNGGERHLFQLYMFLLKVVISFILHFQVVFVI